ncbi:hypothetical protein PIB30_026291 [Stylosanthes scabra]|uniref:Uncharacterized protein n=1 Tax=Stylosanthes scabra TaxID=79078 RepID=A0ABU6U965_9FABA|nr:hypothetical protein [Stylosanthes scabra]
MRARTEETKKNRKSTTFLPAEVLTAATMSTTATRRVQTTLSLSAGFSLFVARMKLISSSLDGDGDGVLINDGGGFEIWQRQNLNHHLSLFDSLSLRLVLSLSLLIGDGGGGGNGCRQLK